MTELYFEGGKYRINDKRVKTCNNCGKYIYTKKDDKFCTIECYKEFKKINRLKENPELLEADNHD